MLLNELAELLGQKINSRYFVRNIEFDSRKIQPNDIFIALPNTKTNSHQFIEDAIKRGAIAAIVSQENLSFNIPIFVVQDTTQTFHKIAADVRNKYQGKVIAITGSTGKTSVKEMINSILSEKQQTLCSYKNFNNHIGVPYTISQLKENHKCCIIEMGANHKNEIATLSKLAKPTIAIINNVSAAHIGEFGNLDEIFLAKSEISHGLTSNGELIVNHKIYKKIQNITQHNNITTFSLDKGDIFAQDIQLLESHTSFTAITPIGKIKIKIRLPGIHNVENALAAITATIFTNDITAIQNGLNKINSIAGRLHKIQLTNNNFIIDDTYNASEQSVIAAINYLSSMKNNNILILGDMGELGNYEDEIYNNIANIIKSKKIDNIFTCGRSSKKISNKLQLYNNHFNTHEEIIEHVKNLNVKNTNILIKGSRFMQMEKIVNNLISIYSNEK